MGEVRKYIEKKNKTQNKLRAKLDDCLDFEIAQRQSYIVGSAFAVEFAQWPQIDTQDKS